MTIGDSKLTDHVLAVIKGEIPPQDIEIGMETSTSEVKIDSLDVVNILFKLEDEFRCNIEIDIHEPPKTIGDLVRSIVKFLPTGAVAS